MLKSLTVITAGLMVAGLSFAADARDIILGASMAKTGPYATTARTSETAIDIAVSEINAAGGINGMKIKLIKSSFYDEKNTKEKLCSFINVSTSATFISFRR